MASYFFLLLVYIFALSISGWRVLAHSAGGQEAKGESLAPILPNLSKTKKLKKMTREEMMAIASAVAEQIAHTSKEVLTSAETAKYLGISQSYLYKLTMRGEIPHTKPTGKLCYFSRAELEQWLRKTNRVASAEEIAQGADSYLAKKGGAR